MRMLKEIGNDICRAILFYNKGVETSEINQTKSLSPKEFKKYSLSKANRELFNLNSLKALPNDLERIRNEILSDFQTKIQNELKKIANNKQNEENLGESDSCPSDDNLDKEELTKLLPEKASKKHIKINRISINSELKKNMGDLLKQNKPNVSLKTIETKGTNKLNPVNLSVKKQKTSSSLLFDKKDKEEQQTIIDNSNLSKYKEQVQSLTKPEKKVNFSLKSNQSLILYQPKKIDKGSQTEEKFFSM